MMFQYATLQVPAFWLAWGWAGRQLSWYAPTVLVRYANTKEALW